MSLYRKYRPKTFTELVGQSFVREVLEWALRLDRIVWGYLFTGPRGTGKTTIARIFAKALECTGRGESPEPCGMCDHCKAIESSEYVDIVEIDAASHTGVDNIREIIEKSRFLPTMGRYKIYIIDEVHMLSKGAFNALLKTLEEPPMHVVFLMATTEPHKVIETILSRVQRFDLGRIRDEDIVSRLRFVAESEGIAVEDTSLSHIARAARGGLRDALTLFEQFAIGGTVDTASVEAHLAFVDDARLDAFLDAAISADPVSLSEQMAFVRENIPDIRRYIEQMLFRCRDRMDSEPENLSGLCEVFDALLDAYDRARLAPDPIMPLELACARFRLWDSQNQSKSPTPPAREYRATGHTVSTLPSAWAAKNTKERKKTTPNDTKKVSQISAETQDSAVSDTGTNAIEYRKPEKSTSEKPGISIRADDLIQHVKSVPRRGFVAMSLRASKVFVEWGHLIILAPNSFHLEKLSTPDVITFLSQSVQAVAGAPIEVRITLDPDAKNTLAEAANEIF